MIKFIGYTILPLLSIFFLSGVVIAKDSSASTADQAFYEKHTKTLDQNQIELLKSIKKESMIIYPAINERVTVTVFTDITCPYCAKLHKQMSHYNNVGITIQYASYPINGLGSQAHKMAEHVWCADDRKKTMDKVKLKKQLTRAPKCDSPIKNHYNIGKRLGVERTPNFYSNTGIVFPAYIPPEELSKILKL